MIILVHSERNLSKLDHVVLTTPVYHGLRRLLIQCNDSGVPTAALNMRGNCRGV